MRRRTLLMQLFPQVSGCVTLLVSDNLFGGAGDKNVSPSLASLGAQVNDIVGTLDDVEVVFNHDHGIAFVHKLVQHTQ